tara:strand:- start:1358 stop:1849 length:492 start_codon:yes stop_codon:yes gene_type:complete
MTLVENKKLIFRYLSEISDPEIPVINIVEMGVVRDVLFHTSNIEIKLTPTYSGCPAMDMIHQLIKEKLHSKGYNDVVVTLVYKPAWTTDWMSDETKQKLTNYGIAPPLGKATSKKTLLNNEYVYCPQCGSKNTEMKSMFGSTACKALYVCKKCLEPFDYFKCI